MNQRTPKGHRLRIKYAGMPKKSEFSDEVLKDPNGETLEKTVTFDEYTISIIAPQEAAERFQKWLKHAVKKNVDYRQMILPMFKPTDEGESTSFPLIGEEGWTISVLQ